MTDTKTRYGGMRRFRIDRAVDPTGVSGTGCVAQGVVFSDGTTVVRWLGTTATTTVHDSIESVEAIHLHGGGSKLRWEDPICFACGSTVEAAHGGGYWCSACGASDQEPYLETRPHPTLGSWSKALRIESPLSEKEREHAAAPVNIEEEFKKLRDAAAAYAKAVEGVHEKLGMGPALLTCNFLELSALAPDLPWVPVLQGWEMGDYFEHVEAYARAGVDLAARRLVGVGTVCRRQNTVRIGALLHCLAGDGLRLHGFGIKKQGQRAAAADLVSADSMAWSFNARRNPRIPGHTHASCSNCVEYALEWRSEALEALGRAA